MFLNLERRDFSVTRFRSGAPLFFTLWLSTLVILTLAVSGCYILLKQQESSEMEAELSRVVEDRLASPGRQLFFQARRQHTDLGAFNFIRVVGPREHAVWTEGEIKLVDFSFLANVDPKLSGAWLNLGEDEESLWTLVTTEYKGYMIQGGKHGSLYYQMYRNLLSFAIGIGAVTAIVWWIPVLLMMKSSLSPLIHLKKQVAEGLNASGAPTLDIDEQEAVPEIRELYENLNKLIRQNRQLVHEMQSSLDNVAHDLRTPMTRLRSVAEYGLQAESDDKKLRDALSDCLEESERVLSMLRIMMSVAEAEAGTMQLQLEPVYVQQLLEDVVALYEYVAEEKGVRLSLSVESNIVTNGDNMRLMQVFANLVDNGIKYGKNGGYVRITAREHQHHLIISVEDDGMGISESEREKVWERLYRGDRSRSEKGLGLGLNYVKAVVEAHEGNVEFTSVLREGSVFTVTLPAGKLLT